MITKFFDESYLQKGFELSFVLGHKALCKKNSEWSELSQLPFSLTEWEDLKENCLQPNEKLKLETKGLVSGVYKAQHSLWKFSFIEDTNCFKAYFSAIQEFSYFTSDLENPMFWSAVKNKNGIFVIGGESRQGKSTLLSEIVDQDQKSNLSLTGIFSLPQQHHWPQVDSVIHLGAEAVDYANDHLCYQGLEKFVVDLNSVKNWQKWIELSESGRSVFLSLNMNSIKNFFQKLIAEMTGQEFYRFMSYFNGIVIQKLVGAHRIAVHEVLSLRDKEKVEIIKYWNETQNFSFVQFATLTSDCYQSLNQSLIQKLIRRKIDVKTAFASSNDPDELDLQLKKMGL